MQKSPLPRKLVIDANFLCSLVGLRKAPCACPCLTSQLSFEVACGDQQGSCPPRQCPGKMPGPMQTIKIGQFVFFRNQWLTNASMFPSTMS